MLLDAKPPKPPGGVRKYVSIPVLILTVLAVGAIVSLLCWKFWNLRQERAVARFLTTLEQADYPKAYKVWQPAPSYTYGDFLHDWGPKGDYGKIREFEILGSASKGASVIVTVRINKVDPPLDLVVNRQTSGLAYSPF